MCGNGASATGSSKMTKNTTLRRFEEMSKRLDLHFLECCSIINAEVVKGHAIEDVKSCAFFEEGQHSKSWFYVLNVASTCIF